MNRLIGSQLQSGLCSFDVTTSAPLSFGILGGMGLASTVEFLGQIVTRFQSVGAVFNSHFPRIVMCSVPLSDHMSGVAEEETGRNLLEAWRTLASADVAFVVVPCNSAHRFLRCENAPTPILDIASAVERLGGEKLRKKRVLFLGTRQTQNAGVYSDVLASTESTLAPISEREQAIVDGLIWDANGGRNLAAASFAIEELLSRRRDDVDVAMVACTELSLIPSTWGGMPSVDTLQLLAEATFRVASRIDRLSDYRRVP
jgi:aspartate racemase